MFARPLLFALATAGLLPGMAQAQSTPTAAPTVPDDEDEIVVTAERLTGSVISDVPPVVEFSEEAIASYGASSITELLSALSPQTGPGRGRGSGGPVVLLNGQRISGFGELRDLPPEAIQRVQILPEEVALQYGYSADQRVVNFILKDNFRAVTLGTEYGASTAGERVASELQAKVVNIGKTGRLTLGAEYDNTTRVLESDRGIIQRSPVFAFADPGQYRTLSPASDSLQLNGVLNRKITDTVSATVNASWQRDTSRALLGLDSATLASVTRPLVLQALGRDVTTDALHGGITLNGNMAKWTWTLTGNYDRSISRTLTDRDVNPVIRGGDTARTQTDTSNGIYTLSGPILDLPAGAVRTTLKAGFATTRLSSQSVRSGVAQSGNLARDEANGRINFDVPLANPDRDVAGAIGKLSINGNLAYRHLSDFGNLVSFGYGLNWQPVSGLTFLASAIGSENEPGIADLGNPTIVTPGVSTYDFTRGETVLINRISGGNRALLTEVQRDTKLSVNYQPQSLKGLTVGVDYFRNRSTNPVDAFPVLTPEIEAAFPDRVTRDSTGRLVSIDGRSINYAATRSDVVRVGFTFQKEFGMPAGGRGAMGGPPAGRGKPGRPAGGFGRGGDGGRWSVALYDSIRLMDQIVIRNGLPVLDLLGGSATGSSGGAARHSFDLDTGWFNKGLGFRLKGSYQSGSVVNGSTAASTLRFGDLVTLNLEAFFNFDSRKSLIDAVPLLKGSRLRLSVNNVFNEIRDVRDGTGAVPLSYQPGYIDPRGRSWKIDFKKTF